MSTGAHPQIEVHVVDGALGAALASDLAAAGTFGARVVFEGVVRGVEKGEVIDALDYATYEPMAQRQMLAICESLITTHGVLAMRVEHSRGRVGVGEVSFRLTVWSAHRKEALAAMDAFIDALKRDVPIWKK